MQNDQGIQVDLYKPRKCSATNRLITAKDHASVEINVGEVDEKGHYITSSYKRYELCGFIRSSGESDDSLIVLLHRMDILKMYGLLTLEKYIFKCLRLDFPYKVI